LFTGPVIAAIAIAAAMIGTLVFILFYHDRKHEELDQWVDYAFSRNALRNALGYYRFMAVSMLFFYIAFTISCLWLQAGGHVLFTDVRRGTSALTGGPISTSLFVLDLVLRGGFFDIMEHFDLHMTHLQMNWGSRWFIWYCFIFRTYYGLTLIKILYSFVWIYGKISLARKSRRGDGAQLGLFD
jgi:hypothetical protein